MENKCYLCPRQCGINRNKTAGFCGAKTLKIAKVQKHFGEEPIISTTNGSGTIFFSHCSLKCFYCQNFEISHNGYGFDITINELANIFKKLEQSDVSNINLVSPTHYTNEIIEALKIYKPKIPIVWNSSGYETVENIKKIKPFIDIYLPDFKYSNNELADKFSKAKNYFEQASQSIIQMRNNQPEDIIVNGVMKKGLIIRHMVLPSYTKNSIDIIEWINTNLGNKTFVSLMSQYMPCFNSKNFVEINRPLKPVEYKIVLQHLNKLGFTNGFTQKLTSSTDKLVPKFLNGKLIEL